MTPDPSYNYNNAPRAILGTMTMGGQTSAADAHAMIADFCAHPASRSNPMLDTAIMYQNGKTQKLMGQLLQEHKGYVPNLSIATKANPFTPPSKNLSPDGMQEQLEESLKDLQVSTVDIFYLHAPDVNHPIEATLERVQELYKQGKFQTFALSNFTAWETLYIYQYMKERSYVLPTIYQGMYNGITRKVEDELFPALRKYGIAFYAYNPLAGGMLTGKYQWVEQPGDDDNNNNMEEALSTFNASVGSRFSGSSTWAKRYRQRFQQEEHFQAVQCIQAALDEYNKSKTDNDEKMTMAEASLRWLRFHSKLNADDGIIIGASSLGHYHANMKALEQGPLVSDGEALLASFDEAAKLSQAVCADYARGYSGQALSLN